MGQSQKKLLGARLRVARVAANVAQESVAEVLGVTRQSVSAWENGVSCPSALQLAELAATYCVCAHTLLFGEGYKPVQLVALLGAHAQQTQKVLTTKE